jgi:hypothetical protein
LKGFGQFGDDHRWRPVRERMCRYVGPNQAIRHRSHPPTCKDYIAM